MSFLRQSYEHSRVVYSHCRLQQWPTDIYIRRLTLATRKLPSAVKLQLQYIILESQNGYPKYKHNTHARLQHLTRCSITFVKHIPALCMPSCKWRCWQGCGVELSCCRLKLMQITHFHVSSANLKWYDFTRLFAWLLRLHNEEYHKMFLFHVIMLPVMDLQLPANDNRQLSMTKLLLKRRSKYCSQALLNVYTKRQIQHLFTEVLQHRTPSTRHNYSCLMIHKNVINWSVPKYISGLARVHVDNVI